MKVLVAVLWLLGTSLAFAQPPDPRDSIILESKTAAPGISGSPAFVMKVYITNKDTVAILDLELEARTIAGNAYTDLDSIGSTGNQNDGWVLVDCLTRLKNSFIKNWGEDFTQYDGVSPDRFGVALGFSPTALNPFRGSEPPNAVRSAIWELRFMSTDNALGEVQFDTARVFFYGGPTGFTIIRNNGSFVQDIPVNFLPGVISVQPLKGDMNLDSQLRPADLVLLLNCVFLGVPPPVGLSYCDLNCDGQTTAVDVALLLNAVFQEEEFPC